ncbi:hypothetical protein SORBI_3002G259466 [Sorghum bicolor]|uniref:MORF/ORRM1/DAG-like MORF domain-containing protein n=2 Tax=Sorghum bicolor TaxID=4558 RepID=A0A1W0W5Y2_SORBI|nr:hypothetical protein SORBI_3002G259466 [Sorghum bicolor]
MAAAARFSCKCARSALASPAPVLDLFPRAAFASPASAPPPFSPCCSRAMSRPSPLAPNIFCPRPSVLQPQSISNQHESTSAAVVKFQARQGKAGRGRVLASPLLMDPVQPPVIPLLCLLQHLHRFQVFKPSDFLRGGQDPLHWAQLKDDGFSGNSPRSISQVEAGDLSEEKARQKIYSVSTRHYFAFGALVSKEISYKIEELPNVRLVLPDSYADVENKDYGGEPFINGEAAPYDPKYHEQLVRNNGPRHSSRNVARRENMQNIHNIDGCDLEHWFVVMEPPPGDLDDPDVPREEIIDSYIKVLSKVVGSEEKARQKIYSVSTRHYFAFGALVSEEISHKIKELPNVRWVLPDSYLDVDNKDYGGEPFINGQAVPYDPKYHEQWLRNNACNSGGWHNDGLRSSRKMVRREVMQNFQNKDAIPGQGYNL